MCEPCAATDRRVVACIPCACRSVPATVLSASLYRLVSFLSKRLIPVVMLVYRHTVSWVDVRGRVTREVLRSEFQPRRAGADRMVCGASLVHTLGAPLQHTHHTLPP
jgi:hypothetical protein